MLEIIGPLLEILDHCIADTLVVVILSSQSGDIDATRPMQSLSSNSAQGTRRYEVRICLVGP
jgi:hypothetical protein